MYYLAVVPGTITETKERIRSHVVPRNGFTSDCETRNSIGFFSFLKRRSEARNPVQLVTQSLQMQICVTRSTLAASTFDQGQASIP